MQRRELLGLAAAFVAAGPFLLRRRARAEGLVRDARGVLDVLPGFEVVVLDRAGDQMTDGFRVPASPDGMGCFDLGGGRLALMRNHELHPGADSSSAHPGRPAPAEAFDPESVGAVTRLVLDAATLDVVSSNLVLTGTNVNCAGGPSPWGWLSCEEDVSPGHGWVFACDPSAERVARPRRIEAYGRFRHEAAAVDEPTRVAYLTEDQVDGCLYRFVPADPADPFRGKLQAMTVEDETFDTCDLGVGEARRIGWVDVDAPAPDNDTVRREARAKGAAVLRRGEGLWLTRSRGELEVFVAATAGGPREEGQVLRLLPERGTVETACASTGPELQMPDNLVMAPSGHLVMAEDGRDPNGLRVLCPGGRVVTLAENPGPGELSGVCVSPGGDVVFANLQRRGITVAIRGPLASLA